MNRRRFCLTAAALLMQTPVWATAQTENETIVRPPEYAGGLRNPLKGLRSSDPAGAQNLPYASLAKSYLRWSDIESHASDGVQKIQEFCKTQWAGLAAINTKVIPRVYLDWPPNGHFWPTDLPHGEYESAQFRDRAVALIQKLAECWDNNPQVAFVETGIVGLWGEQHDPTPSLQLQKAIGDAFTSGFRNKLLMNRYPGIFTDYKFGIYWDSFGHKEESPDHISLLKSPRLASRWKTAPMGGETAFDWGTPLGKDPTDALVHNADAIIALIRDLHWNHLGWLSNYDLNNPVAVANAARVQDALGYRFLLDEVRFPATVQTGSAFRVSVAIRNTGSSPFYYRWPIELSLLDHHSRKPRWSQHFSDVDLREILPGTTSQITSEFSVPSDLPKGEYLLSLAILDPAGNQPAARFATSQYFTGGRSPIGWLSVNTHRSTRPLPKFDDPAKDTTLHYEES